MLKLNPPATAIDKNPRVRYTFIEAVTALPMSFSSGKISELFKRISPKLHGNLKPVLVVMSNDMVKKRPLS